MAIRRDISVLIQGISADIDIVYGTDLVPIEFYVTDYMLPSNAIATLYCTTSDKKLHKKVGETTNNVISFNPPVGYFSIGKNNLQIRITADGKNLYSFEANVNCKTNMVTDDAAEVESQPTLVTQLLTNVGETKALAKQIQEENKNTNQSIEDVHKEIEEERGKTVQLSNPNLFINGNFQIWSNEESFEVFGTNNEGTTTVICDKWYAKHYDLENNYYITKAGAQGIRLASTSEEPCYIYQILDEETFNALQGKTVTLSWSYTQSYGDANHVEYETIEESKKITVIEDLDVFTAMTRIGFTSGIDGCIVHWIKMEVGELKTPCVPDSKDAIICRLEKQTSPQFIQLSLSNAIELESGVPVPFDRISFIGDTFSVSNGIITVKKDIKYVRVSATLGGSAASGRCWMRIMKNNDGIYDALIKGDYFSPTGTVICSAKKGDTFYVYSNEPVYAKSGGVGCYFSIEKIC